MNQNIVRLGFVFVVCFSASYILKVADDLAGVFLDVENLRNEVDTLREEKKAAPAAKTENPAAETARSWDKDWTQGEQNLFQTVLLNTSNFQTFGVNAMTVQALSVKNIKNFQAIDCSRKWLYEFKQKPEVLLATAAGTLNVTHVDIGDVTDFGLPLETDNQANWKRYSDIGYEFRPTLWWDTVLIDGRFRIATFLKVLLKVYLTGRQAETKLLFHDYRPIFSVIEHFALIVYVQDTLAIFVVKPVLTLGDVQKVIAETENQFE